MAYRAVIYQINLVHILPFSSVDAVIVKHLLINMIPAE